MKTIVALTSGIIALSVFLLFFKLGNNYLVSFDEGFYAVMVKEIVKSGNWLHFTFGGENFFAASPLYIWFTALWFSFFGPSEFGVRFFAALSSFGTVMIVYLFFYARKNSTSAIIASIILLSSIKFLYISRVGNFDATLTLFTTSCLILFFLSTKKPVLFILACGITGLAFLTKGPFGLFPLCSLIIFMIWEKKIFIRPNEVMKGILAFLAVILPWHIAEYILFGKSFVTGYYGGHILTKIATTSILERFWWIGSLWQGTKFWFIIGVLSFMYALMKAKSKKEMAYFSIAILFYCFILSLLQTKNDWYLMPIYPLWAITIAYFFSRILTHTKTSIRSLIIIFLVFIAIIQDIYYYKQFFVPQTTDAQVALVRYAESVAPPNSPILLDDFYYPVAMYYSDNPIIRLRANRDNSAAIPADILNEYLSKNSPVLSSSSTVETLMQSSTYNLKVVKTIGDLLLLSPDIQ